MDKRVPAEEWARSLDVPWRVDKPNNGFMLLDDGRLVGAHLAYYSERLIDGRPERFCNLGACCVLPEHRFHSLRLLKALLSQEGYHFTDLSPYGSVIALNERLDFRFLDTSSALVPNFPWPSWPGRDGHHVPPRAHREDPERPGSRAVSRPCRSRSGPTPAPHQR